MDEVTQLLQRAAAGDAQAREPLFRLLYPELMRLAQSHLAQAGTLSLDPGGLLHEAYLRLPESSRLPDRNRRVFYAYASKVMRSVIVDYVRERGAQKRGGGERAETLGDTLAGMLCEERLLPAIDEAMKALEDADPRAHRVVELRYFGGLTEDVIADVLEVSIATVKRDWRRARAFLFDIWVSPERRRRAGVLFG
jgi:RNA polymerase sigma factor (TIGR02999 family)